MTIDEIVSNLANRFQSDGVFAHREVVFVAHSLGGLIVQRFLITHREYAKQVPLIMFYSTPETGAQIAKLEWIAAHFPIKRYCAYEKQPTKGIWIVDRLSPVAHLPCDTARRTGNSLRCRTRPPVRD